MHRQVCSGLAAFLQAGSALASTCTVTQFPPVGSYTETLAVPYSSEETGNIIKRVDDALPPVLVFIHGGWFIAGSAALLEAEARALAYNAHVAVFNIDYHLTVVRTPPSANLNPFPVAVHDARCALRWAANPANGNAWGFDSSRVGVIGFSAGANLATMAVVAGTQSDDPACPTAAHSVPVKAVAALYGVYDFTTGTWPQAVNYLGGQSTTSPLGMQASPLFWVRAQNAPYPPVMLLRGTADTLFPEGQQDSFTAALAATGDNVVNVEVSDLPHGFGIFDVAKTPVVTQPACYLIDFFAANL